MDYYEHPLKESSVSTNYVEFFGLFLTVVGMMMAIFSPHVGHMETALSIFGYVMIVIGIMVLLGGCTVSMMKNENKKKDAQAQVEIAFPSQISHISLQHEISYPTQIPFQHGIQTVTRRGSAGTAVVSETATEENHQTKFSTLSPDGFIRVIPMSYSEEPPPSYYEVMKMEAIREQLISRFTKMCKQTVDAPTAK